MKDEHLPVHQLEHAEPTVIHQHDEDMTALARWLQRGMEQGPRFWLLVGGVVLALVAVAALSSGVAASKSTSGDAWTELTQAKTLDERVKIADAHPKTPVAGWAKLLSAQEEYANGVDDLTTPGKKELAGPRLKKALELFEQVAKEAGNDSSQALGGLYGAARTLEARNELPQAIEQYKEVARRFPNTPEAKQSLILAKALDEPLNVLFYKELYAYKPPATTGIGAGELNGPGSLLTPPPNFGLDQLTKPAIPDLTPPAGLDAPPPANPSSPALETPKADVPKKEETPAPKPTPTPADAPKPESATSPK